MAYKIIANKSNKVENSPYKAGEFYTGDIIGVKYGDRLIMLVITNIEPSISGIAIQDTDYRCPHNIVINYDQPAIKIDENDVQLPLKNLIKEEYTPKLGDVFFYGDRKYILAQTNDNTIALIGLHNGNRWNEPVKVKNNNNLTREELKKIFTDDEWELVEDSDN
ncbi:MAG: hypothetical protein ACLFUH_00915 [Bacteroidales bacterium]